MRENRNKYNPDERAKIIHLHCKKDKESTND
jgi:hypothetical protein